MLLQSTPNISAKMCTSLPSENNCLIDATFFSFSFDTLRRDPLFNLSGCILENDLSPLGIHSGCVLLPFLSPDAVRFFSLQSLMLSACVPRNKCFGLQHGGVSHLWQTNIPSGICPLVKTQAILCESLGVPLTRNCPYPVTVVDSFHSQHSSGSRIETWDQNRSISTLVRLTDVTGYVKGRLASFMSLLMNCVRAISVMIAPLWPDYCLLS